MSFWAGFCKILGYIWLVIAALIILTGIAGVWMTDGFSGVQRVLSPFNVANWIVTIITLAPGLGLLWLANKLRQKPAVGLHDYLYEHSSGINDYFVNAVRVYIWLGEKEAKVAAIAAAKVAAKEQRNTMLKYLEVIASDINKELTDDHEEGTRLSNMLISLRDEIAERNWTIDDIVEEKNRLADCSQGYLDALNNADASVFVRIHPAIFKDKL